MSAALIDLQVSGRAEPLAIPDPRPVFSWRIESTRRAVTQLAYRIVVTRERGSDDGLWDSGWVESARSHGIPYEGRTLPSGSRFSWRVAVRLSDGTSADSESAFETGPSALLWERARWVGRHRQVMTPHDHHPAPYVRGAFTVREGVVRARAYVTAGGLFDLWCNGTRISAGDFGPGWTDYRVRVPFHGHDITAALSPGRSVLGAMLGEGWYSGYVGPFGKRAVWGEYPILRAVVIIEYADGSVQHEVTGSDWECTTGPIRMAELLHGYRQDNRISLGDWSAGFGGWDPVQVEVGPAGDLVPARIPVARVVREVPAVAILRSPTGSPILDFGQNLAGRVRLRLRGQRGTIVRLRHAEILDEDGALYLDNLRGAAATDEIVLAGGGEELFDPIFTYHGFRFVEVDGAAQELSIADATAVAVSSLDGTSLELHTDDEMLDRIQRNLEWGMLSNFIEVPTDCPNRDERLGWAGDAQMFAPVAMYNGDVEAFLTKWLDDIADAQKPNGAFADIAPGALVDFAEEGAAGYGDAGVFLPWDLYRHYGDPGVLRRHYAGMTRWLRYIGTVNPDHVWRHRRNTDYGDWLATVPTDKALTATAYWAYAARVTAAAARVIGLIEEAEAHAALADAVAEAFRAEFVNAEGRVEDATQTALALALAFDLLRPEDRAQARADLVADVESRGHITTGFLGIRWIYPVLIDSGRPDLVLSTLLRREAPSLANQVVRGMTTIGEHWTAWDEAGNLIDPAMNSFNHFALSSGFDGVYRVIGGVTSLAPGFSELRIAPYVSGTIRGSRFGFEAPPGRIGCEWSRQGDELRLTVDIPANVKAVIEIPAVSVTVREGEDGVLSTEHADEAVQVVVGSGHYEFEYGGVR
ncbi:alpha-L-rhamnosidase [Microbacterium sp. MYb66]|uniref:alpha-L-rhamnosidase n=1 Tax=Microbacterium sp. MYb66 TaxID=1848692 RepID=UPI000CFEE694|nr:alpha-L-rhamnosidase [Microbacterium sp. MYb66]PRA78834.1 alpha-L-rhamnosidase [Microbacterium sp. MYb66]